MKIFLNILFTLIVISLLLALTYFVFYSPSLETKIPQAPQHSTTETDDSSSATIEPVSKRNLSSKVSETVFANKASVQLENLVVTYKLPDDWEQFSSENSDKASLISPETKTEIQAGNSMIPADMTI